MEETPRHRFSDADLAEFRVLIEQKLTQARNTFEEHRQSLVSSQENSSAAAAHDPEDSSESSEREFLLDMMARQRRNINELEAALVRVGNKTFGICLRTGELINPARLRVAPTARYSIPPRTS
jgi:RNA polymerase-binding transcription factor DksA